MITVKGSFSRTGFTIEAFREREERPYRTVVCTDAGPVWRIVFKEEGKPNMEYHMNEAMAHVAFNWGGWFSVGLDWDLLTLAMRDHATHSVAEGRKNNL